MSPDPAPPGRQTPQGAPAGRSIEPAYLTAQDVAELLVVDAKTVTRWVREDASLPVFRYGRTVRFPRAKLLAWLRGKERRAVAVAA